MVGWMDRRMDGRWELLWHAPQDTHKGIGLAFSSGKEPSWSLRTWIPVLALPSTCYIALYKFPLSL